MTAVKQYMIDGSGVTAVKTGIPYRRLTELMALRDGDDVGGLYERVPWLYRAAQLRAGAVSRMPRSLYAGDTPVDESDFPFRLTELLKTVELHLTLYGAAYLLPVKTARGRVVSLRALQPGTVEVLTDNKRGLLGFRRTTGAGSVVYGPDELVHVWLENPNEELSPGVAPARVALEAAAAMRNGGRFTSAFFKNGAIFPQILTVVGGANEAEIERLQSFADRTLRGVGNAFRTLFVRREITATKLGQPLNELGLSELAADQRREIAAALGVPPSIIDSETDNFATAQQADINFYDKTVVPEVMLIAEQLNAQLFGPLGLWIEFEPGRLEVFQARELEKALKLEGARARGDVTRDEWRALMGMGPYQGEGAGETVEGGFDDEGAVALRLWERKALRRLKEGKPEKMTEFEHPAIAGAGRAAIVGALEACETADDVRAVFIGAEVWAGYG